MTCRFSPGADAVSVENLHFSNISVDAHLALDLKISNMQNHPPLKSFSYIKNITFNHSFFATQRCCYLLGYDNALFSGICFSDTEFTFTPEDPDNERFICNWSGINHKDAIIYIKKAEDITFSDCRFIKNAPLYRDNTLIESESPRLLNTEAKIKSTSF